MRRALLIIQREYLTRVKKRNFLLITFLTPLFLGLLMAGVILLPQMTESQKTVYVIDQSGQLEDKFPDEGNINYVFVNKSIKVVQGEMLQDNPNSFILKIPDFSLDKPEGFEIISKKSPSISLSSQVENMLEEQVRDLKIKKAGLDEKTLKQLDTDISLSSVTLSESGEKEKASTAIASFVSMAGGFLIYFFIFMYGGQVTTGVHEEKTSRIVEILISSVRPIQLMFGKIIGIALVGLTQFLLWVILTGVVSGVLMFLIGPEAAVEASDQAGPAMAQSQQQQEMMSKVLNSLGSVNFPLLIFSFLFYFLFGYFMYSSLFAGVAAAVDNQTDMRQFMFPLSIPLILAIAITPTVILQNPSSGVAVAGSLIPFTAPVIMIARLPFGVPPLELISSYVLMILGFLFCVWLAAKVYRTGILMYGKRVTPGEIMKWIVK